MPQHRRHESLDVVDGHVTAALQERPRLGPEDQELHGPGARAPRELIGDEVGHALFAGPGLPHQR